jgi:hypothetical protein
VTADPTFILSATAVTALGAGTHSVSLVVVDESGNESEPDDTTLTIAGCGDNAPAAVAGGPYSTASGDPVTLDGSFSSDPDAFCGDSITEYRWTVGTLGTFAVHDPTFTVSAADIAALGAGTHTVTLSVVDESGNESEPNATTLTVTNDPPHVNAGPDASGAEGSAIALNGTVTDTNAGDTASSSWTYSPGAGVDAGATCSFSDANSEDTTLTCTDDGAYIATLTADDGVNPPVADDASVTVANEDPVATTTAPGPQSLHSVGAVDASASFTDAGSNDTHTCSVDWGDGSAASSGVVTEAGGDGTCTSSHTYSGAGLFTITVTITDDDGGSDVATVGIVVYDPSAGFVTGGGWITSPAGAYVADPSRVGKATFGFVSKYHKGATTPSGQTEFQFDAARLKFHSSSYEWLVVSGPRAQYKGTGTLNGVGGYDFTLSVIDGQVTGGGGVDRFRMRIWDASSDALVYDNQLGAANNADATTALGGGSIIIHKGK